MQILFGLVVRENKTGAEYTFNGYSEKDDDGCSRIYVCHINNDTIVTGVYFFHDDEDNACMIDLTSYTENDMVTVPKDRMSDTLIKGALKYLLENYKTIQTVSFQDGATIKENRVLVTPKLLLLGKPSWYTSILGAKSAVHNVMIEKWLSQNKNGTCTAIVSQSGWGIAEDYSQELTCLLVTRWYIERETVEHYPVTVVVQHSETCSTGWINTAKDAEENQQAALAHLRNLKTQWLIQERLRDYNFHD